MRHIAAIKERITLQSQYQIEVRQRLDQLFVPPLVTDYFGLDKRERIAQQRPQKTVGRDDCYSVHRLKIHSKCGFTEVKIVPKTEKHLQNEKKNPKSIAVRRKVTIFATAKLCLTHNQQTN
jgi:hypothetical protein